MFLVAHNSYSEWLEVIPMRVVPAERTVDELRSLFARLGLPKQGVSDSGPQFISREMAEFVMRNGDTSHPGCPVPSVKQWRGGKGATDCQTQSEGKHPGWTVWRRVWPDFC